MAGHFCYRLWGKTSDRSTGTADSEWAWHTAPAHMVDVGHVAESWLDTSPSLVNRFADLAGLEGEVARSLVVTLVALHDLGKVHRRFQSKSERGWAAGYGGENLVRSHDNGIGFDHGLGTFALIDDLDRKSPWRPWGEVFRAVAAHHGRFHDDAERQRSSNMRPTNGREEMEAAGVLLTTIPRLFCCPDPLPVPPRNSAFAMLLAGFCSVCDWLGSDTTFFPFRGAEMSSGGEPALIEYLDGLRHTAVGRQAIASAGLLAEFTNDTREYADLFPFLTQLRSVQAAANELDFGAANGPEMVIVEAPMGVGKTETALYLSAKAIRNGAGGLYFALPTQASSNAMFDRVAGFAESMSTPGGKTSLVLAHGGRHYNNRYRSFLRDQRGRLELLLAQSVGIEAVGDDAPSELVSPDWLQSSRRALLAGVGVGTIDQAMLGAMGVRHAFVRLFALAGRVVVFDEIHAYDSYMNVVIVRLLEWLHVLGAKVILLSATLPRALRRDLLKAWGGAVEIGSAAAEDAPYPQIIHATPGGTETIVPSPDSGAAERIVSVIPIAAASDSRTGAGVSRALELAAMGGCVGWVRNTVREAQDAWRQLRSRAAALPIDERPEIRILHARFTRNDRSETEEDLVQTLGRDGGARRPQRAIVVATQVIEQSVDLDFDAMITDLAPIDLMLQRSGRLWRHGRPLAERFRHRRPALHVLLPDADELRLMRFGPSGYVYEPEILTRSARVVEANPEWTLPAACRHLVGICYDRDETWWTPDRLAVDNDRLENVRDRCVRSNEIMTRTAARTLLVAPGRRLPGTERVASDTADSDVSLSTRYGGDSIAAFLIARHDGELRAHGDSQPLLPLPPASAPGRILDVEDRLHRASVSFPWYGHLDSSSDPDLDTLRTWWRHRHPFDSTVFLLLDDDGCIVHDEIGGTYGSDGAGLELARRGQTPVGEMISYEEL